MNCQFGNAVAIDGGEVCMGLNVNGDLGVFYPVGSTDYPSLGNKPSINGVVLLGNKTSEELLINEDKFFSFSQLSPSATWDIEHNLGKFPSVTVVDSGGSCVIGDVEYIDTANVRVTFQAAFAGKAYLN